MSGLPRGLLAAAAGSLGVHLALVASGWLGAQAGGSRAAEPAVLVARLIEAVASPTVPTAAPDPLLPAPAVEPAAETPPLVPVPDPIPVEPAPAVPMPRDAASAPMPAIDLRMAPSVVPAETVGPTAGPGTASADALGLDRSPQPLDDLAGALPAGAGARGGSVTVRFVVSERGVVEKVTLLRSSSAGLLDEAGLAALGRIRFSPGLRSGAPTRGEVAFEIEFAAIGKGTDSSGRTY